MLASIHDADGLGRTVSVEGPQGITTYEYDEDSGLLTKQTLPNGVYTLYQYNNRGQMNGMAHYQPGNPDVLLAEYSDITYDAAGRRTGFSAQIAALPNYSGSYEFTYNAKGELTGEDFTPDDELLPPSERDYLYTASGNCSNFNGVERRYNGANQLTQEWVNGQWVTVADYDDRGNPIEYRGHDLEFNQGNHLTAFDETLTAGYSNDGRRIWKEVNNQRTFFIYDGETLIGEMDEYGTTTAVNTIGATGLVSRQQSGSLGASVYYLFDPLGNVLHRLNGEGDIVSSDVYDAWGKLEYSDDLTDDPYGYKGQYGYYTDHETGLILCTHRYYDPQTGRWLTKDPIGHEGGVNLYGYCGNDAVNGVDPNGHYWQLIAGGLFLAVMQYLQAAGPVASSSITTAAAISAYDSYIYSGGDTHQTLDQLGEIPVVGEGFDFANSAWYFSQGDYFNGSASAAAFIPVAGTLAKRGIKGLKPLARYSGPKPKYHVNPAHVYGSPQYNRRKTILPGDAMEVYANAVPDDPINARHWYGNNGQGQVYLFHNSNDGSAHFSLTITDPDKLNPYVRARLGL